MEVVFLFGGRSPPELKIWDQKFRKFIRFISDIFLTLIDFLANRRLKGQENILLIQ